MRLLCSLRRTPYLGVLFFLSACSAAAICPKWTSIAIDSPCVQSTRWIYPSLPDCQGLTLEYTSYPTQDRFFLNLPCVIPASDPEVHLNLSTGELTVIGELYEGGQRIALPESVNLPIFEALNNCEPFTIRCERWLLEVN